MINRDKFIKGVLTIVGIMILVWGFTQVSRNNSKTLADYARENPEIAYMEKSEPSPSPETDASMTAKPSPETGSPVANSTEKSDESANAQPTESATPAVSTLIGASLNGQTMLEQRTTYEEGFYYEPLSDNLRRYITGVSFPATPENSETTEELAITYDDLTYLHILHYDFEGNPTEGELICNNAIAQDLVEIFHELYLNEYQLEKVRLIDEYDGDDTASMEDNNTSCFNYRVVEGSTSLSKHALGLALDINPFYNPYITYEKDGSEKVSPVAALAYADRDSNFPYKIDENDLCYKLFKEHGFTWGGNWNSCKDYQHFQKVITE